VPLPGGVGGDPGGNSDSGDAEGSGGVGGGDGGGGAAGGAHFLLSRAYRVLREPLRPPRLRGDTNIINGEAAHQSTMFSLVCGADSMHGIPALIVGNVWAAYLRGAEAQLRAAPQESPEAAFWRAQLRAAKPAVHAIRLQIMGVTSFEAAGGAARKVVRHTPATEQVLKAPFVAALVKRHRALLDGARESGGNVDDDAPARAAAQAPAEGGPKDGSWGSFARTLERHPRRAVYYRYSLLSEREAWVAELRALQHQWPGARLTDARVLPNACEGYDAIVGIDPNAGEEEGGEHAADGDDGGGGGDDDDSGAEGDFDGDSGEGGERDGARPPYRGKRWYPCLFALVPRARAVRRSARFSDDTSREIFGRPLRGVLTEPPPLPRGAAFGSSVTTNGFSVSFPYATRAAVAAGAAGPRRARSAAAARRAPAPPPPPAHDAPPVSLAGNRSVFVDTGMIWLAACVEMVVDPNTGAQREARWGLTNKAWRAMRGDAERLVETRRWCAALAAPGGAFEALQAVTRCTTDADVFDAYCRNAHGEGAHAHGALQLVLDERLAPRWAHAAFRTWSKGHSILEGFWAGVRAGRVADGTAGVRPVIMYGDGDFAATLRGTFSSPTTSLRRACVVACGAGWVRPADEHRTSKCCSDPKCGGVLDRVAAATPQRIYAGAEARAAAALPPGFSRAPPRPIPPWRVVRGMYYCPTCALTGRGFRHRDFDAARLMLRNELHKEAHGGPPPVGGAPDTRHPLPFLRRGQHLEPPPGRFWMMPEF